jgi:hypothetical protein
MTTLRQFKDWVELGKQLFRQVLEQGGVWHLYGHSWEIEELGIWGDLREMLDYVSNRQGVSYVTNGQLLSLLDGRASAGHPTASATKGQRQVNRRSKLYV